MIVGRGVDGCELLRCPHPPEAEHRPLSPSKRRVRILRAIFRPTTGFLPIADVEFRQGGTIGREAVGQDLISATIPPQGFLQEFQRGLLVARFRYEALERFTFVADGQSEIVPFTLDLHKTLVKVPVGQGAHPLDPPATDLGSKLRPQRCPQNLKVSLQVSMPRSWTRFSSLSSERGDRKCVITAKRMISWPVVLKAQFGRRPDHLVTL
jgi:hypothetical protein